MFNSNDEQRYRITQLEEVYKNTRTKGAPLSTKNLERRHTSRQGCKKDASTDCPEELKFTREKIS
jgi:hypothetical protein